MVFLLSRTQSWSKVEKQKIRERTRNDAFVRSAVKEVMCPFAGQLSADAYCLDPRVPRRHNAARTPVASPVPTPRLLLADLCVSFPNVPTQFVCLLVPAYEEVEDEPLETCDGLCEMRSVM